MAETTETQSVKEGKAEILQPGSVFYNPVQEFNRDLTIAVITQHAKSCYESNIKKQANKNSESETGNSDVKTFEELKPGERCEDGINILEGLAASGLRSIRFAKEIPGVKNIVTNDFDKCAVEFIKKNTELNNVQDIITPSCDDATIVMYKHKKPSERFDVIDLDPYGTAAPFLDSAVQAIKDGGLMCVTCTDLAILCGNAPEACYAKYGSMSLKIKCCHEMALRILLQCVESHANRYSRYIEPLISISADFYIRVFLRVYTGQNMVKRSVTKLSSVYQCTGCGSYTLQPLGEMTPTKGDNYKFSPGHGPVVGERCVHCGGRHQVGGPVWSAPIHEPGFVDAVLGWVREEGERYGTSQRIQGVLGVVREELPAVPLYYITDHLSCVIHCTPPNLLQIRSAILHAGYQVSHSHAAKNSLKTTAPAEVIWDILRCWVKDHPVNPKRLQLPTPGARILEKPPKLQADFSPHPDANPKSRQDGLLRWQQNPERNWGPKPKAKKGGADTLDELRAKGLEKKKNSDSKRKREDIDFKKFQCKRYKAGKCELGDGCKYSHDIEYA